MKTTLDKLKVGEIATIININNTGSIRRRLLDIGLIPGSIVTSYLESPFKDPIAYKIKNAIIAIRKSDSKEIEVDTLWRK